MKKLRKYKVVVEAIIYGYRAKDIEENTYLSIGGTIPIKHKITTRRLR
jgi:hypothetical protein